MKPFLQCATLVARLRPRPLLGILGQIPQNLQPLLAAHAAALKFGLHHLRVIGYDEVQRYARGLAEALLDVLGPDGVAEAGFSAIPRGGGFVLAMLSYLLDLRPCQMSTPKSGTCCVVVDDCALSGTRFRDHLSKIRSERVIFAPLISHPELRRRIEHREERVVHCLSAVDLAEHDIDDLKPGWRERWKRQRPGLGYWVGRFEALVFPWAEPDRLVWDPIAEEVVTAWPLTPPECRLAPSSVESFQVQPQGPGPLRPGDEILFGDFEEVVLIGHVERQQVVRLEGTAAAMWQAVVRTGTVEATVESLLAVYEVDEATLRKDVHDFVAELLERGLLVDERSQ